MVELLNVLKPEFVFSMSFFIGFIGLGWFINNSLWPWLKDYLSRGQDLELARQQRNDKMMEVMGDLKQELGSFRETHSIVLSYIIADLTDKNSPGSTATTRALKRRQSTQDLLLRHLENDVKE